MNRDSLKAVRPILLTFVILNGLFIALRSTLQRWETDQSVLIMGNLLIFVIILVSFFLLYRAIQSPNPQVFVRAMYGSFLVKFFLLAIAAFVYIQVTKKDVNKQALFACVGLYFLYTFMEISALMKLLKQKRNV